MEFALGSRSSEKLFIVRRTGRPAGFRNVAVDVDSTFSNALEVSLLIGELMPRRE